VSVVANRKSGRSLNHIIGCVLDCGYCVRHFWGNFDTKIPVMLCSTEDGVAMLTDGPEFTPHVTPLQIFNKATDPFLRVDARLLARRCPAIKPAGLLDTLKLAKHIEAGQSGYGLQAALERRGLTAAVRELAPGGQPHRALWDTVAAALLLTDLAAALPVQTASVLQTLAGVFLDPQPARRDPDVHLRLVGHHLVLRAMAASDPRKDRPLPLPVALGVALACGTCAVGRTCLGSRSSAPA
jgi:hypothetical protein